MLNNFIKLSKDKCFQCTALLFLFYVFPILINNNFYYVDDIIRLLYGNHPWTPDGRVIGDLLYTPFSFSFSRQTDAYPLPLLVGLCFLAASIAMLYNRFGRERPWTFSLCTLPLLANPFFISNLHFRYDSAFMVLSLGFSILPYALDQKSIKRNLLLGSLFVICAFSSYQSSVNVFIGMIAIEMYYNLLIVQNVKLTICSMLVRVFQLLIGFTIYLKIIVSLLTTNIYFNHYNKIISFSGAFLGKLFRNYLDSFYILQYCSKETAFIFIVLIISFLFITAFLFLKHCKENQSTVLKASLVAFLLTISIMIAIAAIPGIIVFGERPTFVPRVYLGFGIFMAYLLLPNCWAISKHSSFFLIAPSLCTFFLFNFAYTAHNSINEDYRYQNNISSLIIQDINRLYLYNKNIFISGSLPPAPSTRIACQRFPIIKLFLDSSRLGHLTRRNGMDGVKEWDGQDVAKMKEFVLLLSANSYEIYTSQDSVIVKLLQ